MRKCSRCGHEVSEQYMGIIMSTWISKVKPGDQIFAYMDNEGSTACRDGCTHHVNGVMRIFKRDGKLITRERVG